MFGLPEAIDGISWAFAGLFVLPLLVLAAPLLPMPSTFIGLLRTFAAALDHFARQVGTFVAWLSVIMVLVQTIVVLQRHIFGVNFIWLQESITYMHGMLFMLAAAYTLWKDGHVRVDIFYREAAPKQKAIVDLLGIFLFLVPMMILILQMSDTYVELSWKVLEGSPETSGIKGVYILKSIILVFPVLMLLQAWSIAVKSALVLIGRMEEPGPETASGHAGL